MALKVWNKEMAKAPNLSPSRITQLKTEGGMVMPDYQGVHTLVQASDILISRERSMLLFEKARQMDFSGIGLSQRGPHQDRCVHLDTKPRKALWSY